MKFYKNENRTSTLISCSNQWKRGESGHFKYNFGKFIKSFVRFLEKWANKIQSFLSVTENVNFI